MHARALERACASYLKRLLAVRSTCVQNRQVWWASRHEGMVTKECGVNQCVGQSEEISDRRFAKVKVGESFVIFFFFEGEGGKQSINQPASYHKLVSLLVDRSDARHRIHITRMRRRGHA